jgi:HlyD family secretion protein
MDKLTIRAPIAGTVLQVNAKLGELASPSAPQPLVLLGDVSALRVGAEVDEHDFGEVKIGQPAVARAEAVRGREFAGKASAIAPVVQPERINARGSRNLSDVNVVEVLVDLNEPGPLGGRHESGCVFPARRRALTVRGITRLLSPSTQLGEASGFDSLCA